MFANKLSLKRCDIHTHTHIPLVNRNILDTHSYLVQLRTTLACLVCALRRWRKNRERREKNKHNLFYLSRFIHGLFFQLLYVEFIADSSLRQLNSFRTNLLRRYIFFLIFFIFSHKDNLLGELLIDWIFFVCFMTEVLIGQFHIKAPCSVFIRGSLKRLSI